MKVATTKHSVLNRLDSILRFDIFTTFISHIGQKTGLNRAVSSCIWQYSMSVLHGKQGYPTPAKRILHPILHPNMPLFTGSFTTRCRKCRIFFKNFGSASIWVIDMFLHGSSICLIINILTSKKVVDVRIFLYLCM